MSQRSTLGEVLNWRNEIIHPRDLPSGKTVFVGLEHVESHTGRKIGENPLDLAKLTGRKARFYPGDLVYGYLRPYLNKLWVADREGCCSVDQYVFSVREDRADRDYVSYFMRSPVYLKTAPITASPGQLPRIRVEEVAAVPIPLPALSEQRRIAGLLRERITNSQRARQALEEQLLAAEKLPSAYLREAFASQEAKTWPSLSLGDLLIETRNGLYKPDHFYGRGTRIVKMFNIGRLDGRWDLTRIDRLEITNDELRQYDLQIGDIVLNRVNSRELVGKCAVVDSEIAGAVFESKNMRLRVDPLRVEPYFIERFMNGFTGRNQIDGRIKQIAGMATLSRPDLDHFLIPLPGLPTQQRIASELRERLADALALKSNLTNQLAAIDRYQPALLRDAFSDAP